jgi:hypothetical protein
VGAVDLSRNNIDALNKLTPDLTLIEAERTALAMARAAVEAAGKQNIEDATRLFSKACEGTTNLAILSAAAEFFRQIGDTASSGRLVLRQAAIARDRKIAAQYYMTLLPKGFIDGLMQQMIAAYPPEMAAELREIFAEVFGQIEDRMLELMVKYYSTAEILELARFMASPEGQASMNKQPLMIAEMMDWAKREAQRILARRDPELYAAPSKAIDVATRPQIADAHDVTARPVESRDGPLVHRGPAHGEDN